MGPRKLFTHVFRVHQGHAAIVDGALSLPYQAMLTECPLWVTDICGSSNTQQRMATIATSGHRPTPDSTTTG